MMWLEYIKIQLRNDVPLEGRPLTREEAAALSHVGIRAKAGMDLMPTDIGGVYVVKVMGRDVYVKAKKGR